jgi:hypothetical protein
MRAASLFVASSALAVLSIAHANAAPVQAAPDRPGWVGCSISAGTFSSTCRNGGNHTTYLGCMTSTMKNGWRDTESSWYCTSLRLK